MTIRKFNALLLTVLAGALTFAPGAARATNGAQFTSLSAEYIELENDNPDDIYTLDRDGHEDDLVVTFTETGTGNSKAVDISVTAMREISGTCVSAFSEEVFFSITEPIALRFPDEEGPGASATFTTDQNGHLTGSVSIHTSLAGYWSS